MSERSAAAGSPMKSGTFVLRGGRIVSMDPVVGDLPVGDVLIDHGRIAAIAPALDSPGVDIVDVSGHVVMPGFVDSHRHVWESAFRGTAADMSLLGYFGRYLAQVGPGLSAEALHASTLLGAVEALDAGVTSLLDWCNATNTPAHADAAVEALQASGIRAVFGHGNPEDVEDVRRVRDLLGDNGLVTLALALIGPEFTSVELATPQIMLARELGIIASMHIGCGMSGPRAAAVSGLAAAGLMGPDLNFVHCNTISDAEVVRIIEAGSTISITPLVECLMGHGTPALARFLRAGGEPSLGVDVVVASASDLFGQMRAGLLLARLDSNQQLLDSGEDPISVWPSARTVLSAATLFGARAAGLDDRVGSLTVGKQADIVILNGLSLPADSEELVGAIVSTGSPTEVDSVLVGGRFVKRHGRLLDHDLQMLRTRAASMIAVS